ncbi:hypothetical protein IFM61392_00397 [Aspergillus lentulus]|nr:hypothetical protein IFM61392_00397 [Aspergillus lentulus]
MNQAGTRLKQWQVTGAAWMLEQEKSTVGGDILAQTGCQQMLEQPNRACPQSEAAVLVRDRIAGKMAAAARPSVDVPVGAGWLAHQRQEYELERVVAKRTHKTKGGKIKTQYLVKWLGFEDHENTWLDDKDLEQAQELINEYENRQAATTSVPYVTIGSQMGEAAESEFTDTRSSCRILLTSYQCGAHGLNLHAKCSRVILLKPSRISIRFFRRWDASTASGSEAARRCGPSSKSIPYPEVMSTRVKDDGEDEEAADQAEAEVIQRAVLDLDRMNARMTPRGRKRERARQDSQLRAARDAKCTKATASKCFGSGRKAWDYELHRGAEVQPSAVTKQRADQSRNSALLHYEETEEPLPVPKKPATILTSHVEWDDSTRL